MRRSPPRRLTVAIAPLNDATDALIEWSIHRAFAIDRPRNRKCRSSPALRLRLPRRFYRIPSSPVDQARVSVHGAHYRDDVPCPRALVLVWSAILETLHARAKLRRHNR